MNMCEDMQQEQQNHATEMFVTCAIDMSVVDSIIETAKKEEDENGTNE